ncbi:unnamed protein product [Rotaria sp. Silwood2]|nr:unnamed protein product [Rotaria sp. Silwood2]CAF4689824.1 unnamed protein product [Rotaria sp. Silwood2]
MASSEKKNKSTLFDDDDDLDRNSTKKKLERIRVNDIPDIDKYVLNLTSEKIYDFIKTFIKVMNGVENVLNMEEKFNKNIFGKFELINNDHLHLSSYFSLIGTFLITIISHRTITTEDLCLFSTILQDDIINKNISNWSILNDFIKLFRTILHTEFVKNIYYELINDELESKNILDADRFKGKRNPFNKFT